MEQWVVGPLEKYQKTNCSKETPLIEGPLELQKHQCFFWILPWFVWDGQISFKFLLFLILDLQVSDEYIFL